jgi:large subunit ribosomal protein L15
MTTYKTKKVRKYRGSGTHGCGSMKKRRGAGNRGGRGNAGTGKRADTKKDSNPLNYFGKNGFVKKGQIVKINAVNISYLIDNLDKLVKQNQIEFKNNEYVVDLKKLGYNKLLGYSKKIDKKLVITTDYASGIAVEKIKNAGGNVVVLKEKTAKSSKEKKNQEDSEE